MVNWQTELWLEELPTDADLSNNLKTFGFNSKTNSPNDIGYCFHSNNEVTPQTDTLDIDTATRVIFTNKQGQKAHFELAALPDNRKNGKDKVWVCKRVINVEL